MNNESIVKKLSLVLLLSCGPLQAGWGDWLSPSAWSTWAKDTWYELTPTQVVVGALVLHAAHPHLDKLYREKVKGEVAVPEVLSLEDLNAKVERDHQPRLGILEGQVATLNNQLTMMISLQRSSLLQDSSVFPSPTDRRHS